MRCLAVITLALLVLTGCQTTDYDAAEFKRIRPLAEQGNAREQSKLGWMYSQGNGVVQDFAKAAFWYRKAAEQGDARARSNLGFMYSHGEGVAENDAEAAKWYRLAADQGHAKAQYNLGNRSSFSG